MLSKSKSNELTVGQLKKRLSEFEKDSIIELIADLYKSTPAVVSNFTKICADDELIARLNYHFAKKAVEFTNNFGDIDTPFYNALACDQPPM